MPAQNQAIGLEIQLVRYLETSRPRASYTHSTRVTATAAAWSRKFQDFGHVNIDDDSARFRAGLIYDDPVVTFLTHLQQAVRSTRRTVPSLKSGVGAVWLNGTLQLK
ncbi:hypothetical protein VTO73DRAFT_14496 [Trametes versicolor]